MFCRGVVVLDIDLEKTSVNQCADSESLFSGSHKCRPETTKVSIKSKILNIDTDAKFRFERGIDPLSIEQGLEKAARLIKEICGGEISEFDIQKTEKTKKSNIKFNPALFEKNYWI